MVRESSGEECAAGDGLNAAKPACFTSRPQGPKA
jgi:hypothetical protein